MAEGLRPRWARRRLPLLSWLYALLCLASVLYVFLSGWQLFGIDGDPLSALPAMLLALPWSALLTLMPDLPPALGLLLLMLFMGLNLAIAALLRRWHLRHRPGASMGR
jgi:hypothetical protein